MPWPAPGAPVPTTRRGSVLEILRDGADPDAFFRALPGAPSRVLLLDYDGTLAPFVEDRNRAVPYPEVREVLPEHLDAGASRIVVVSGRAIRDLRPLLGIEPPPEMWGSHGWERHRPGEGHSLEELEQGAREALEEARRRALELTGKERVEVKPVSVAVHVRGLDAGAAEELLDGAREAWSSLAGRGELELHDFDGGLELRAPGRDKGTAIQAILAEEPAAAAVAYLGDDLTDEDAFQALGGRSGPTLRVLVRSTPRETEADVRIDPPAELLSFLERWRSASDGSGPGAREGPGGGA